MSVFSTVLWKPLGQNLHAVPSHEQIESLSREGYIKVEGYDGTEESLDNITVNITDKGREYYEKYCKL